MTEPPRSLSFLTRFLTFYVILALPFLRQLVRLRYEPWHGPEVVVILGALAVPCVFLAWISRGSFIFLALIAPWAAFFSTTSVQREFWDSAPWLWVFALLVVLIGAAAALLRDRFPGVMALMLGGMLAAQAAMTASEVFSLSQPAAPLIQSAKPLPHKIYFVFDEQTGIAGLPKDIPACAQTANLWSETLQRHGFTVFSNAFSNYFHTRDSIPSILNGRLVSQGADLLPPGMTVAENQLFASEAAKGKELIVYQSSYLSFASSAYRYRLLREYDANDVSVLLRANVSWKFRARHLFGWYLRLDAPLGPFLQNHFPRFAEDWRFGPLVVRKIWPSVILGDILKANRPTLFFAHLLNPHQPYVFDANGAVRPEPDWYGGRLSPADDLYRIKFKAHCEQSSFLARELDELLSALQQSGVLESSEIILHGDHGAKISEELHGRLVQFPSEPTLPDLLHSFSAMLAIRKPGRQMGTLDDTKGSILFLMQKSKGSLANARGSELNKVYLFRPDQTISLLDRWN